THKEALPMSRTIQIHSQFGDALLFKELHGVEGISSLYQYDLLLSSKDANLDIKSAIGSQLCVCIQTKEGERHLQGVVTDFGYDRPDVDEQGYHIYSCTLRPNLWHLTQTQNSRVFVEKTVIEIATTILSESGIEFDNKCQNQYRIYGQSTQYHESNFDYLSRLFEQEGIYYYFTQTKDKNILVLSDQNSQQDPIMGNSHLIYHADVFAGAPDQAYLDTWQHKQHLNTTHVSLGDYNYQTKKSHLITDTPTHGLSAQSTERFEPYAQFKSLGEANHYKQIHKEHYQALTEEVIATGNVLTLCAGHHFTLQRHPHQKANIEYLITEVGFALKEAGYTTGDESGSYRTSLKAIPFSLQYRPKKQTPKPQVVGTQAAIITGPAGEEVYTNEYGDIKLQFHWDRYGPMNEKSSAWIRVIQASAGVNFGSINVPRIGEEVLVDFINGDADRPVVVGRLYNVQNPPPWGYPAAAKKSGIKSKSFNSPLENFNEFMFDDTEGAELVNFQAQKDLTSLIKNDETRHIKNNRTTTVDVDETVTVHGKRTETVDKDETITIHQNRTETVDKDETITIHQNRKERVDLDETISIGGNRTETVEGDEKI
ncbi:type VI secretion protein Vgr, partial [Moraxella cuniculi]